MTLGPAGYFLERLVWGGAQDPELMTRAKECRSLFDDEPIEALRWRPRLRKAAQAAALAGSADLWLIVQPILYGPEMPQ